MAYTIVGQLDACLLLPRSIGCHAWSPRTSVELVVNTQICEHRQNASTTKETLTHISHGTRCTTGTLRNHWRVRAQIRCCRLHNHRAPRHATIALRHGKAIVVLRWCAQQWSCADRDRNHNTWTVVWSARFRLHFYLVRHVYDATLAAVRWRHRRHHQIHGMLDAHVLADTTGSLLLDGFHLMLGFG